MRVLCQAIHVATWHASTYLEGWIQLTVTQPLCLQSQVCAAMLAMWWALWTRLIVHGYSWITDFPLRAHVQSRIR